MALADIKGVLHHISTSINSDDTNMYVFRSACDLSVSLYFIVYIFFTHSKGPHTIVTPLLNLEFAAGMKDLPCLALEVIATKAGRKAAKSLRLVNKEWNNIVSCTRKKIITSSSITDEQLCCLCERFPNIVNLDLDSVIKLTPAGLLHLQKLLSLTYLELGYYCLDDNDPVHSSITDLSSLGLLTRLDRLNVHAWPGLKVESFLGVSNNLTSLRDLKIQNFSLTESHIDSIALISSLKRLRLVNCMTDDKDLSVPLLTMVSSLTELSELGLIENLVGDAALAGLCSRKGLVVFLGESSCHSSVTLATILSLLGPKISRAFTLVALEGFGYDTVPEAGVLQANALPIILGLIGAGPEFSEVSKAAVCALGRMVERSSEVQSALIGLGIIPRLVAALSMLKNWERPEDFEYGQFQPDLFFVDVMRLLLVLCRNENMSALTALRESGGMEIILENIMGNQYGRFELVEALVEIRGPGEYAAAVQEDIDKVICRILALPILHIRTGCKDVEAGPESEDESWEKFSTYEEDRSGLIIVLKTLLEGNALSCKTFLRQGGELAAVGVLSLPRVNLHFVLRFVDLFEALIGASRRGRGALCEAQALSALVNILETYDINLAYLYAPPEYKADAKKMHDERLRICIDMLLFDEADELIDPIEQ